MLLGLNEPRLLSEVINEYAGFSGLSRSEAHQEFYRKFVDRWFVKISSARPAGKRKRHSAFQFPEGKECQPSRTPFSVYLEVTQACNLRCIHCFAAEGGKKAILPLEKIVELFDSMHEMGVLHLTLSGGEPTLHPQFSRILELATDSSMAFTILTNATRFERNPELLEQIIECSRSRNKAMTLGISLDGVTAESHEKIRGAPGSYELTKRAIEKLADAGVKQITLHMMMCNHNFGELDALVDWAVEMGVEQVVPFDLLPYGGGKTMAGLGLSFDQQLQLFENVRRLRTRFSGKIRISPPRHCHNGFSTLLGRVKERTAPRPFCSAGIKEIAIRADGKIHPCPFIWADEFTLGNLYEDSLIDAWHSEKLGFFRGGYRVSELGKCANCQFNQRCVGIECRATAISQGDKYGPGGSCALVLQRAAGNLHDTTAVAGAIV